MCASCIRYEHKVEQATYASLSSYLVLFHYYHETVLLATIGYDYDTSEAILEVLPWETLGLTLPTMYGRQDANTESTLQAMRQQNEWHKQVG
jgi:hypothetical protein